MKRILALALLFVCVIVFYGCNAKSSESTPSQAETTATETTEVTEAVETQAPTEPITEAQPPVIETQAPTEPMTLPYVSEHTAVELIDHSIPELIKLMGNDCNTEYCGERLVYYTSGGLCFYNDDTLPGFAFFIDEAEGDYYTLTDSGKTKEQALAEIKENILSGKYDDFDFMCVYGGARYNDRISSDMHYVELSEIIGSYELGPLVGSGTMRQSINGEPAATIYYEDVYGKVSEIPGDTPETKSFMYLDEEEAKAVDPAAEKICVIKETVRHH